jgi:hypothetical protein
MEEMEDAFSGKGAAVTSQVIVEITFARKKYYGMRFVRILTMDF